MSLILNNFYLFPFKDRTLHNYRNGLHSVRYLRIRLRSVMCLFGSVHGYSRVSYYAEAHNSTVETPQPCMITTWVTKSRRLLFLLNNPWPLPTPHAAPRETMRIFACLHDCHEAEDLPAKYGDDREARPGPKWQPGATWNCAQTRLAKPRQARENKWLLFYTNGY